MITSYVRDNKGLSENYPIVFCIVCLGYLFPSLLQAGYPVGISHFGLTAYKDKGQV